MGWYRQFLEPRLFDWALGAPELDARRARLLSGAALAGRVLEIGSGTGHSLRHYPDTVETLYCLEPNRAMAARAERRLAEARTHVVALAAGAEAIPLPDASVDTAVTMLTLCSVPAVEQALGEVRRVLVPGGRLLFLEHGRAPDEAVRRWQRRLGGIHAAVCGGCRVDRDVPALLEAAGLRVEAMTTGYQPKTPKYAGYFFEGVARK